MKTEDEKLGLILLKPSPVRLRVKPSRVQVQTKVKGTGFFFDLTHDRSRIDQLIHYSYPLFHVVKENTRR